MAKKDITSDFYLDPVDIVGHYPEFLQENLDYNALSRAKNAQIQKSREVSKELLNNILPQTCNEYGISKYEEWLGLTPNNGDTLEQRRARVKTKMNETLPYTEVTLVKMLAALLGWGNFELSIVGALVTLSIDYSRADLVEIVIEMLERVLPMNLHYKLIVYVNTEKAQVTAGAFVYSGTEITINPHEESEVTADTLEVEVGGELHSGQVLTVLP